MIRGEMNDNQRRFADEYLKDLNATRAYKAAGYTAKTDQVAAVQGSKLLRNPKVAEYIELRMAKREKRTEITQDRVLTELAKIAFFDPRKMFHEDGSLKQITELDDETAAALGGFDVSEIGAGEDVALILTKKFKMVDRKGALELLMRHLGMFNDKQTVRHEFADLSDTEIEARIAALSRAK